MTPADALDILTRVLAHPPPAERGDDRNASLAFGTPTADGRVEVTLVCRRGPDVVDEKIQELPLLPTQGAAVEAYEAFAGGVRLALARCDLDATMPMDLLAVNLVRVPDLRDPEEVAAAILHRDARRRALAVIEVGDLAEEHGIAALTDAAACSALWTLANDGDVEEAEDAARWLRDAGRLDTIPHVIVLLERRQATMATCGGLSWITDEGRNVDVTIARLLEPLVRRASSRDERARVEALAVVGLFDAAHEHAAVEWMFET